jgi:hypothetical protein
VFDPELMIVKDLDEEDDLSDCKRAPEDLVRELVAEQREQKKKEQARKNRALRSFGLEPDIGMEG